MNRAWWLALLAPLLFLKRDKMPFQFPTKPEPAPQPRGVEAHLKTLRAPVADLARQLLTSSPVPLTIVQSFRSSAEQARLYAQGRTTPGAIVTNAKPGSSYHEYGLAFDVAILQDGKPTWPNDVPLWTRIGEQGEALGLVWGGRFPGLKDYGHFELRMPGIGPGQSQPPGAPVA